MLLDQNMYVEVKCKIFNYFSYLSKKGNLVKLYKNVFENQVSRLIS